MLFKVFIKSSNVLKAFGFHSQTNLFELDFFMRKKILKMVKPMSGWAKLLCHGYSVCLSTSHSWNSSPLQVNSQPVTRLLCITLYALSKAMSQGGARQYK